MITTKEVIHLNTPNFDKAIKNGIVLVDFWAEWCAPCRMQNPILEEVATEMGGQVLITKLNVDENRDIAAKFGIRSIPTLMIFKNGKTERQLIGVQQKQTLINTLNNLL